MISIDAQRLKTLKPPRAEEATCSREVLETPFHAKAGSILRRTFPDNYIVLFPVLIACSLEPYVVHPSSWVVKFARKGRERSPNRGRRRWSRNRSPSTTPTSEPPCCQWFFSQGTSASYCKRAICSSLVVRFTKNGRDFACNVGREVVLSTTLPHHYVSLESAPFPPHQLGGLEALYIRTTRYRVPPYEIVTYYRRCTILSVISTEYIHNLLSSSEAKAPRSVPNGIEYLLHLVLPPHDCCYFSPLNVADLGLTWFKTGPAQEASGGCGHDQTREEAQSLRGVRKTHKNALFHWVAYVTSDLFAVRPCNVQSDLLNRSTAWVSFDGLMNNRNSFRFNSISTVARPSSAPFS